MPTREQLLAWNDSLWAEITRSYLKPEDGVILEGGCGMGIHVAALRNLGYEAIGVDFAKKTVEMLNGIAPELDIRLGDVRALPLESESFAGYWSLGVIEHFWTGYHDIAREMYRVLRPGGYLFLAFPYMNCVRRRWKSPSLRIFPRWSGEQRAADFYQFALNPATVRTDFEALGFKLVEIRPVLGRQGMQEDAPELSRRIQTVLSGSSKRFFSRGWRRAVHELNLRLLPLFSYSILLVLRK